MVPFSIRSLVKTMKISTMCILLEGCRTFSTTNTEFLTVRSFCGPGSQRTSPFIKRYSLNYACHMSTAITDLCFCFVWLLFCVCVCARVVSSGFRHSHFSLVPARQAQQETGQLQPHGAEDAQPSTQVCPAVIRTPWDKSNNKRRCRSKPSGYNYHF